METTLPILEALFRRRSIRALSPAEIEPATRDALLDAARHAPSGMNLQPYRFYWIQSQSCLEKAVPLCMGQAAAATASALVVAVADIGSWRTTLEQKVAWMEEQGASAERVGRHRKKINLIGWVVYTTGWFDCWGHLKRGLFWLISRFKVLGTPPLTKGELFRSADKNTAYACMNLMIAAEACGLASCPMEGFDRRRLGTLLGLERSTQEAVLVIALGKLAVGERVDPQWRRPLEQTVTYL